MTYLYKFGKRFGNDTRCKFLVHLCGSFRSVNYIQPTQGCVSQSVRDDFKQSMILKIILRVLGCNTTGLLYRWLHTDEDELFYINRKTGEMDYYKYIDSIYYMIKDKSDPVLLTYYKCAPWLYTDDDVVCIPFENLSGEERMELYERFNKLCNVTWVTKLSNVFDKIFKEYFFMQDNMYKVIAAISYYTIYYKNDNGAALIEHIINEIFDDDNTELLYANYSNNDLYHYSSEEDILKKFGSV